jgi:hypothetical protein
MQGARNAANGMYTEVHEDCEYCARPQAPLRGNFLDSFYSP